MREVSIPSAAEDPAVVAAAFEAAKAKGFVVDKIVEAVRSGGEWLACVVDSKTDQGYTVGGKLG